MPQAICAASMAMVPEPEVNRLFARYLIDDPTAVILFVGYQGVGTLGQGFGCQGFEGVLHNAGEAREDGRHGLAG